MRNFISNCFPITFFPIFYKEVTLRILFQRDSWQKTNQCEEAIAISNNLNVGQSCVNNYPVNFIDKNTDQIRSRQCQDLRDVYEKRDVSWIVNYAGVAWTIFKKLYLLNLSLSLTFLGFFWDFVIDLEILEISFYFFQQNHKTISRNWSDIHA